MNLTLIQHGYPIAILQKVDRKKYYDSLQKADKGNLAPLSNLIGSAVEQSLDTYLRAIDPKAEPLITIAEASKNTTFSPEYLGLLARKRRIPARKVGKNWMITRNAVREYMQEQRTRKQRA
jgi:excisionase family DNA binding protein